ncbi:MAG: type II toxin-antitoxin system RelE/ParE family toxin [Phycisphaeraceae bacterium]
MRGVILPAAERDLLDVVDYLTVHAGEDVAEDFVLRFEVAIRLLRAHPEAGAIVRVRSSRLAGLRRWPIARFGHLIYYRSDGDSLSNLRVLHPRRDQVSELF